MAAKKMAAINNHQRQSENEESMKISHRLA